MINFETSHPIIRKYHTYLKLERSLSPQTVEAYLEDLRKLIDFAEGVDNVLAFNSRDLESFFVQIRELGIQARSQARIVSGVRSFFRFLLIEDLLSQDPSLLIEAPRLGQHLPEVLSIDEIDALIEAIDLSTKEGQRNKAILETLYGCGLRVTELTQLKLSNCYFDEEYVLVEGKGSKQRLVPISNRAIHEIQYWLIDRNGLDIKKGNEDFVFLNRRGAGLSRSMIFRIIRSLAAEAGITKTIGPHTFRHSFATHLLEGGANLRVIQQMLGHESIQTTEVYTHMDKTFLREQILQFHPHNIK
jgi:integrase/recombinase XerD